MIVVNIPLNYSWKGPLEIIYSCSNQGHLQQITQNHVQSGSCPPSKGKDSATSLALHSTVWSLSQWKVFLVFKNTILYFSLCPLPLGLSTDNFLYTMESDTYMLWKISPETWAFFFSPDDCSYLSLFLYEISKLLIIFVTPPDSLLYGPYLFSAGDPRSLYAALQTQT